MGFTRKFLKALGIEDEKIDQIIEAHTEVTDALKAKVTEAENKAKDYDDVVRERDDLKSKANDGFKEKYEKEHAEFEKFKSDLQEKESRAAKEKAVKAYFESKDIKGTNLDIAMRGSVAEINAIEMDGDKIKDTKALDDLVSGTFAGLVVKTAKKGTDSPNPPANNGGESKPQSRAAILARQYHEAQFGKTKEN